MVQNTKYVGSFGRDLATQNVDDEYTIIMENVPFRANFLEVFSTSDEPIRLGFGMTGEESEGPVIFPTAGASIQRIACLVNEGMNIYLKTVAAEDLGAGDTANTGEILINFYQ